MFAQNENSLSSVIERKKKKNIKDRIGPGLESHIMGTSGMMKGLIELTLYLELRVKSGSIPCVFKGTSSGSHCAIEPLGLRSGGPFKFGSYAV